ncbi:ribosome biogenesis GTPase Der [Caminibacter pacificus]|uniref:GTPase Der n=1 Tax=Caminibacter pacificus TaxID=1424653 RepID=A0AAJ4UXC8_9BACT|nr:ribosome biogenesis GTPase Der [Caminibacter pacificus]NPA88455.1 ribosome biogenesis GTPase Der [Campylobacterota bacterium]QCI27523.1 ribosome biogenesis GTPase Der [Caminibacter pacificus]ROR38962.1 GTP-binding protein [Caminibacter pacificus]
MLKIAILGKPNVGKSSFFNRVLRQRDAIVSEKAGTTRDIKKRIVSLDDELEDIILLDTGGLEERDELFEKVKQKALDVAKKADLILYMVDAKTIPDEKEIEYVRTLQRLNKPMILVVNKVDNDKLMENVYNFYELGIEEVYPISIAHNRGVGKLIERIKDYIPKKPRVIQEATSIEEDIPLEELFSEEDQNEDLETLKEIKVAIVGRVNVGKSSLLNALVGEERAIVSDVDGTTIDPIDESIWFDGYNITFIDTAGIRRRGKIKDIEKYALMRTEKVLKEADVAILVLDSKEGIVELDEKIGGLIQKHKNAVIIVANKWDEAKMDYKKFETEVRDRFKFLYYAPFMVVSAKTKRNLDKLKEKIIYVYGNYTKRVPTSKLNEWIKEATQRHHLPTDIRGREIKIYYATQFGIKPPTIALVMNKPKLHFSYERYLINFIRSKEDFTGTPIVLIPREKGSKNEKD